MSNTPLLQCHALCKQYQDGAISTQVLKSVSFAINQGDFMAIVGSSGSGKSTLLHLLGGLDSPTSGEVIFKGQSLNKLTSTAKADLRNTQLGFIYQFHHLLPDFTALENVAMPLMIGGMSAVKAKQKAMSLLDAVGLTARAHHHQLYHRVLRYGMGASTDLRVHQSHRRPAKPRPRNAQVAQV